MHSNISILYLFQKAFFFTGDYRPTLMLHLIFAGYVKDKILIRQSLKCPISVINADRYIMFLHHESLIDRIFIM